MAAGEESPSKTIKNARNEGIIVYRMATKRVQKPPIQSTRRSHPKEFRLEDYKLEQKMDQLEKEKQHCILRHNEEKHVFKMSVRLPKESGLDIYNWEKYGEHFRANGEYRESAASSRVPSAMPKQCVKTKREHQSIEHPKGSKHKAVVCKTVADLIALMRDTSSSPVDNDAPTVDSHRHLDATPVDPTINIAIRNDRNDNLRLLLENYEVFVPKENLKDSSREDLLSHDYKNTSTKFERNLSSKVDGTSSCDDMRAYDKVQGLVRSKSVQARHNGSIMHNTSHSVTSFHHHHIGHRLSDTVMPPRSKPLRPTVRQVVTQCDNYSRMPREFFWSSPSKRISKKKETKSYTQSLIDKYIVKRGTHNYSQGTRRNVSIASDMNNIQTRRSGLPSTNDTPSEDFLFSYRAQSVPPTVNSFGEMNGSKKWKEDGNRKGSSFFKKESREDILEATKSPTSYNYRLRQLLLQKGLRGPSSEAESGGPPRLTIKTLNPHFTRTDHKKSTHSAHNYTPQNSSHVIGAISRPKSRLVTSPKVGDTMTSLDGGTKTAGQTDSHYQRDCAVESRTSQYGLTEQERSPTMMIIHGMRLQKDHKDQQAKETRQKMDQFFARLDSVKKQSTAVRPRTTGFTVKEKRLKHELHKKEQKDKVYKRAAPWPVQVWC